MYLDDKGLIVQMDGDAGDCLQREGFWYEGCYQNPLQRAIPGMASYVDALHTLTMPGGLARSWMPGTSQPPWNDPSDTSRDQLVSNIRALGYYRPSVPILSQIFWAVVKNFSRFPNGDIAFINDYARFIRAFGLWYLWPLLVIFDLPLIVNSIIRCIKGRNYDDVGDDINHIGDLAQACTVYPTGVSNLARKIYILFRPSFDVVGPTVIRSKTVNGAVWALNWYFRMAAKGNIEFASLWEPVVTRW